LLIDQNISYRLKARIASVFPDVLERSIPPKIIWLRLGNCSVSFQVKAMLDNAAIIEAFLSTENHDVLEIFR